MNRYPFPSGVRPEGNKMQRLEAQLARSLPALVLAFPNGRHDRWISRS
jgi:hypothetical protein